MILYNVTINIDTQVEAEWLQWMKDTHIPNVLETGLFTDYKIYKILAEEPQGRSYSIQYFTKSLEDINEYQEKYAPALRDEVMQKYGKHLVAFRTMLESVD